ncbi:MAG TPA: nitroreductase family protein [Bacteroidales bacterium]|nr:nitroreductase family protein [Bacteroidales bacterium]HPS71297.1 nitroreductase family protein [Bacteroidales bacterium]
MKKVFISFVLFFFFISLNAQDIKLPPPNITGGLPLMETLSKRETNRNFSQDEISTQKLSDLLWAAFGVNRPNGRRTAPSARNVQETDIYVFIKSGVYIYIPEKNILKQVITEDCRTKLPKQEGFTDCPLLILLVTNYDKMDNFKPEDRDFYGAVDAGYISQNIYLYCTSENLSTCAIGMIYREELKNLLHFNGKAIIAHSIGVKEPQN